MGGRQRRTTVPKRPTVSGLTRRIDARHLALQVTRVSALRSAWPYPSAAASRHHGEGMSQPRFNEHTRTSSARGEQQLLEALELPAGAAAALFAVGRAAG